MSGDVNISTCWCCKGRIHFRGRAWRHKPDGLPYSSIGGDHVASPFKPDLAEELPSNLDEGPKPEDPTPPEVTE